MKKFLQRCRDGEVEFPEEGLNGAVHEWHISPDITEALHDWLGFTWAEYADWLSQKKDLQAIIADSPPILG